MRTIIAISAILLLLSNNLLGTEYSSIANKSSNWEQAETWAQTSPIVMQNGDIFIVNGTVTIREDFNPLTKIQIKVSSGDTLIIAANFALTSNASDAVDLIVESGAVVLFLQNFSVGKNFDLENNGKILTLGNVATEGAGGSAASLLNNQDMYVFGSINTAEVSNNPVNSAEAFLQNEEALVLFILNNYPGYIEPYISPLYALSDGNWTDVVWSESANGADCGYTPLSYHRVYTNNHNVMLDNNYTVRTLEINGGSFDLRGTNYILTITGSLNFADGYIFTDKNENEYTSSYVNMPNGAAIAGTPSNSSFIDGRLQRTSASTQEILFPVGTNGVYAPIGFNIENKNVQSTYSASYYNTAYVQDTIAENDSVGLKDVSSKQYWDFHKVNGSGGQITLYFPEVQEYSLEVTPTLLLAHWKGDAWEGIGLVERTASYIKTEIMNSFSPVTEGSSNPTALPVELITFKAAVDGTYVQLYWATASETNNDYFEIERSNNGINFQSIGTEEGNGNSREYNSYSFTDYNPISGIGYYRLKQVDYDGTTSYSKVISAEQNENVSVQRFTVYPNPANSHEQLYVKGDFDNNTVFIIYDVNGQVISKEIITVEQGTSTEISLNSIDQAGKYVLSAITNGIEWQETIIVK